MPCAPKLKWVLLPWVLQVAVGDLEWSLMSVADAHRRLQAARSRQRHLLLSLDEVSC